MSQIDAHLNWCLKDPKRLIELQPNPDIAQKHLKKSEYNYQVLQTLERLKIYDWAFNIGFYAVYHCFLAILAQRGYESKNQSCTLTVLLALIQEKKLDFDIDLIQQFDLLDVEKSIASPTVRKSRERATYGVETSINLHELKKLKELIVKVQRETIRIIEP